MSGSSQFQNDIIQYVCEVVTDPTVLWFWRILSKEWKGVVEYTVGKYEMTDGSIDPRSWLSFIFPPNPKPEEWHRYLLFDLLPNPILPLGALEKFIKQGDLSMVFRALDQTKKEYHPRVYHYAYNPSTGEYKKDVVEAVIKKGYIHPPSSQQAGIKLIYKLASYDPELLLWIHTLEGFKCDGTAHHLANTQYSTTIRIRLETMCRRCKERRFPDHFEEFRYTPHFNAFATITFPYDES